jgi:hypothetical protein
MLDDILALDASLEATGLAASDAALVRHAFLTTLRAAQQRRANGRPEAAAPPAAVPVERAAVAEPEIDWDAVLTAPGPVAAHPAAVASAAEHLAPEGGARPAIRIRGPRR